MQGGLNMFFIRIILLSSRNMLCYGFDGHNIALKNSKIPVAGIKSFIIQ